MHPSLQRRILPEAELLLHAASGAEADDDIRTLLDAGLDWNVVIPLVQRDRAHAALWPRLCAVGLEHIPEAHREQLKRMHMVGAFRQGLLEQRLEQVVGVFEQHGIEVLLLKGSALALTVYKSFAARPMADLDLLVAHERAAEAQQLLLAGGWSLATTLVAPMHEQVYAEHHHLPPLVNGPVRLEVHTEPMPSGHPFRFNAAELWQSSLPAKFKNYVVRVPDLQHQAMHLCLHYVWSHMLQYGAWRALRDLRTISELPDLDWREHVRRAHEARAASSCYWAWRLARGLVNARVPDDALAALAPSSSAAKLSFLERHFVASRFGGVPCPSMRVNRALWESAVAPGRSGHGRARPCSRDHEFVTAGVAAADPGGALELPSWRDSLGWRRYLRAALLSTRA